MFRCRPNRLHKGARKVRRSVPYTHYTADSGFHDPVRQHQGMGENINGCRCSLENTARSDEKSRASITRWRGFIYGMGVI